MRSSVAPKTASSTSEHANKLGYTLAHADDAESRLVGALTGGYQTPRLHQTSRPPRTGRPFRVPAGTSPARAAPVPRKGALMTTTATLARTARRLSGFKPTGHLQLGNYLGAIRPMVQAQHTSESIVIVVDLHSLTVEHDPAAQRALTEEQAAVLLAAGVDPQRTMFYVQSHVPEHLELHYLLECVTSYGEAHRM